MNHRWVRRATTVPLVALLSLTLLPVVATAATETKSAIAAALDRIDNGTYTQADLDYIRKFPDIAGQVPDPKDPGQSGVTHGSPSPSVAITASISCGWWVDVWFRRQSLLGSTIYVWHHYVQYCLYYNSRIASWQARYDYLTSAQSLVYVRELVVNQQAGLGTFTAWSHLQRHLEYCVVHYGCYANVYPWSKIWVNASGGWSYQGHN
jgi:hypothetical protein